MNNLSAPIITKMLYISRSKTSVNNVESMIYLDYINRTVKDKIERMSEKDYPINEEEIYQEVLRSNNIKYNKEIEYDEIKNIIETTDISESIVNEIDTLILNKLSENKDQQYDQVITDSINQWATENNKDNYLSMVAYNNYISERTGSHGLFSDFGADIEELKSGLKLHRNTIYLPIISLKEKDADLVGLNYEDQWREKARIYIDEFSSIMNIPRKDISWLCAYHEKHGSDINKLADAEKQPHLHFMIWTDQVKNRRFEKLSKQELTRLRQKTSSVFLSDYLTQLYSNENELKRTFKRNSNMLINEVEIQNKIFQARIQLNKALNATGRKSKAGVEKAIKILRQIEKSKTNMLPLSENQINYLLKMKIKNEKTAIKERINLLQSVDIEIEDIAGMILKEDVVKEIYKDWLEEKYRITRTWASEKESNQELEKTIDEIKRQIYNSVLKDDALKFDVVEINENLIEMILEKLNTKVFKANLDDDQISTHLETIIKLLLSTGKTDDEIFNQINFTFKNNLKNISSELIAKILVDSKNDKNVETFTISIRQFYSTMNDMFIENSRNYYPYYIKPRTTISPSYRTLVKQYMNTSPNINKSRERAKNTEIN